MLDEQSFEKSHVSKSKARRRRAATLRIKLWNASQIGKSATATGICNDASIASLHSRLAILEFFISDLHWVTIGQWRSCHGFASERAQTESDDTVEGSGAMFAAKLKPTDGGGKAAMGEVSPRTSSGILPRSLDLVPRAGCTGPSGLTSKSFTDYAESSDKVDQFREALENEEEEEDEEQEADDVIEVDGAEIHSIVRRARKLACTDEEIGDARDFNSIGLERQRALLVKLWPLLALPQCDV